MAKTGPKSEDMTGQVFNRLTVLSYTRTNSSYSSFWLCRCSCGIEKEVNRQQLKTGETQSCGCLQREFRIANGKASRIELEGTTSKLWTYLGEAGIKGVGRHQKRMILARCGCGTEKTMSASSYWTGEWLGCGCQNRQYNRRRKSDAEQRRETRTHATCKNHGVLPIDAFYKTGQGAPRNICKECVVAESKKRRDLKKDQTIS